MKYFHFGPEPKQSVHNFNKNTLYKPYDLLPRPHCNLCCVVLGREQGNGR